ncbi:hypothetical protein PG991_001259 [Apiospora marii]|uniref:Polyketide synthase n=1 Tax=Apiospora marii TaxID=335849 RepID=A0ABR1SRJ7_9PEZI
MGQYLRYLEVHGLSHREFVADIREGGGGVYGYCGGLPAAICISCAEAEEELIRYMGVALKILVGIGAYTEAADENAGTENTLLAIRLKYEGQGEELTRRFPGTYISAVTGPRSISIGGPAATLREFAAYATEHEGVRAQEIHLGGSAHNPANAHLAAELCRVCLDAPQGLQLPHASQLLLPLRTNQSGERLTDGLLADDLIWTMLASRCEWLQLLKGVAQDLTQSTQAEHCFVVFGWDDCITLSPFVQARLRVTKVFAKSLILETPEPPRPSSQPPAANGDDESAYEFPENAIAVTGAACRLPGANSMAELWELVASGKSCAREVPEERFKVAENYRILKSGNGSPWQDRTFYGNFLDDVKRFDHAFFGISAREAANMDPQQRIMLELSFEALEDAGYLASPSYRREAGDDVGCFLGLVLGEYVENTNAHPPTAYTSTGTVPAFVCGRLSHAYGWSGPAEMFNTACSSSMVAINRACKAIQAGECRMALAGGANVMTGMNTYLDLAKAGFLSPTGQCKPFSAAADGYCRADGCGMVVLKRLSDAVAGGDPIWGVIAGVATNQGGLSSSLTVPDAAAQKALYKRVLGQAGMSGGRVTYVEAHGTGTQVGDPIEMSSIRSVFGSTSRRTKVAVGSIKGNIGHAEPAAGVAGLLKVLVMLRHQKIPPQASYGTLNPNIPSLDQDGMEIVTRMRDWDTPFRAALVNSYGAAGSNGALLVCGAPRLRLNEGAVAVESRVPLHPSPLMAYPLIVTAASTTSLLETAKSQAAFLDSSCADKSLVDIAYTLDHKRQRQKYQAIIKASTVQQAAGMLRSIASVDISLTPAALAAPRPVVLAFSGQSDRMVALPKSLYSDLPAFRFHLDMCDTEFRRHAENPLLPAVFQTEPVTNMAALQCGMFAVQYACAECWIEAGLQPQAVIGHSLGEYAALAVSGVLSLADAIRLVYKRARLIETRWGADKGSLLAIECTAEDFQRLSPEMPGLEISCFNGPHSIVVAGREVAVEAAEEVLKKHSIFRFQRLRTTHAFHSALTDPILSELHEISESSVRKKPTMPLYTCSLEGTELHGQDAAAHMRQPVFFDQAVQRIEGTLGSCTWVEAGLDTPIIAMAKRCCRQSDGHVFHPGRTKGLHRPSDVVADVVTSLWSSGLGSVRHWGFLRESESSPEPCRTVWLPPYRFAETRHWLENIDRAGEMHTKLQKLQSQSQPQPQPQSQANPPPLVSRWPMQGDREGRTSFLINTKNPRYRSVVEGHIVCSRPLCPAPLYMECATAAVLLMQEGPQSVKKHALKFEDFHVRSPLGLEPSGTVVLRLEKDPGASSQWRVEVTSILNSTSPLKGDSPASETVHLEAIICFDTEPRLDGFQRLVSRGSRRLAQSSSNEKLHGNRAYKLFSRVVQYGDFFKGLISVQVDGSEAIATVQAPSDQPHRHENAFWGICDAVVLDMCIHALGLLVNTSDHVSDSEVAVMMGLDRAIITPDFVMDTSVCWTIYASFDFMADQNQAIGDVFVCSAEGKIVAIFTGCRMSRLPTVKLEKALDAAFSTPKGALPGRASHTVTNTSTADSTSTSTPGVIFTPGVECESPIRSLGNSRGSTAALLDLIADCTMLDKSDIQKTIPLALMGLDSLGSAELSDGLSSKFGLSVPTGNLLESNVADLERLLNASLPDSQDPSQSPTAADAYPSHAIITSQQSNGQSERFFQIVADACGANHESIRPDSTLVHLGVDSLALIDMKQEIEDHFSVALDLKMDASIEDIMESLGVGLEVHPRIENQQLPDEPLRTQPGQAPTSLFESNPFEVLRSLSPEFDAAARRNGVTGYWSTVAPLQDDIAVAYIVESLSALGVDLRGMTSKDPVPAIPYLTPKYDKLMRRILQILEKHGIVSLAGPEGSVDPTHVVRGSAAVNDRFASELLTEFSSRFPAYVHETALIGLTGPELANCLSGRTDSVSLMFGNPQSMQIMENYYGRSPLTASLTNYMIAFLVSLLRSPSHAGTRRPVRILEVGGGTGGTTRYLVEALVKAGIVTEYTFTDISPSLVKNAKKKFQHLPWITYSTLNLESEIRPELLGQFDLVVATNVVHATTDRTAACGRIRSMLAPAGGLFVLAETTTKIDWCDICFGLLDGWWFADGPIAPLQTAAEWAETMRQAGFASTGYSNGSSADTNTTQLIVGSNVGWDTGSDAATLPTSSLSLGQDLHKASEVIECGHRIESVIYKEVDGERIHADVYYPRVPPTSSMPIALMIHGGGYVTLSRRAIRPEQTRHLLKQGILPVSIDYRLCPEIDILEGPLRDVCDAYRWARESLPQIAREAAGVRVDPARVAVVGWSTGGQLAMSLGWTAHAAGLPPPSAVLSFYAPVDFESGGEGCPLLSPNADDLSETNRQGTELDRMECPRGTPKLERSLDEIIQALPPKPISNASASGDVSDLGWMRPGDPRSDLLVTMYQERIALPVLLNGLSHEAGSKNRTLSLAPPSPARVASISPLAQLRAGKYNAPTFIIHGTEDEVAPFAAAERFVGEMRRRLGREGGGGGGLRHGFLPLPGARHLFDLRLGEASAVWDEMVAPGYRFLFEALCLS